MPELFPPKKLVAFHLNKGMVGFVGEIQSRMPTVNPSFPRRAFQEMCQEKIKNLPTYGDTKSFCMRKAEIPHKYHRILCILQSSKMSITANMDCFQKTS